MRCPSCGTDNAPDSRFCGGCGARLAASGPRVAPTQKILDEASFPQQQLAPAGSAVPVTAPGIVAPSRAIPAAPFMPQSAPLARPASEVSAPSVRPVTAPASPSVPRSMTAPPSAPAAPRPNAAAGDAYAAPAPAPSSARGRPQLIVVDDPSLSLPIAARRPWGLILVVLLLDICLAVAGVLLLREGLAERPSRSAPTRTASPPP